MSSSSSTSTIVISVLNWNAAQATLDCVASLQAMTPEAGVEVQLVVIDNGSRDEDWRLLRRGLDSQPVHLLRNPQNLGFAGGHNVAIRLAQDLRAEHIWLVNNDALVQPDTLAELLAVMRSEQQCGAVSPVIATLHDENVMDFCGAIHRWDLLESIRPAAVEESLRLQAAHPQDMWVFGTAVLLRMAALEQVGLLDDTLFAYYEDDDIGVRLSRAGWLSRIAPRSRMRHAAFNGVVTERPAYYFYLMARNCFRFWLAHTPPAYRRFIRLRLLEKQLFVANRLLRKGLDEKARAVMLGIADGLAGRGGAPDLARKPPLLVGLLRQAFWFKQYRWLKKLIPVAAPRVVTRTTTQA